MAPNVRPNFSNIPSFQIFMFFRESSVPPNFPDVPFFGILGGRHLAGGNELAELGENVEYGLSKMCLR